MYQAGADPLDWRTTSPDEIRISLSVGSHSHAALMSENPTTERNSPPRVGTLSSD